MKLCLRFVKFELQFTHASHAPFLTSAAIFVVCTEKLLYEIKLSLKINYVLISR